MDNSLSKQDQVNYQFKLLYVVGLLLVVAGHTAGGGVQIMSGWFAYYAYHLQLFEFCSGYFYKESAEENVLLYLRKKILHLVVPLYVWNFIYALIVFGLSFYGFKIGGRITFHNLFIEPMLGGHQYGYNLCTWFVMPLFMAEMINVIFRSCCKRFGNGVVKETLFLVLYFLVGMLGVWLAGKGYNKSWWLFLTKIMSFLAFYGFGRYYKAVLEKYFDKCATWLYFFIVFSMQLAVICKFGRIPSYGQVFMSSFKGVTNTPYMPYLVACIAIMFWLRITKILEPAIGKSKILNVIADNAYPITLHQFVGFMLIKWLYGVVSLFTNHFKDFNWVLFKSKLYWYYVPKNIGQFKIIYLIAGILIPILIAILIDKGYGRCKKCHFIQRLSDRVLFRKIYCIKSVVLKKFFKCP